MKEIFIKLTSIIAGMAFQKDAPTFEEFIKEVNENNPNANIDLITKAYRFAEQAHTGQKRESGEDFFVHPLSVAKILIGLRADTATICAALLHDTVEDTSTNLEIVKKEFGDEIALLVDGVTKERKTFPSKEEYKAENLRKILLATTKDIRVMLVRLADRLHNMRTLSTFREDKRKRIAKETLEIYAPIAHKLGCWRIKGELEDLSLRYLDFETYSRLKEKIAEKRTQREAITNEIVEKISQELENKKIEADVYGRAKYFYSIYKKMLKKGRDVEQIYDLIAIRIITKTIPECYKALYTVHSIFKPEIERVKDFIAHPKANGYRSIHTTVSYKNKLLEIQIRTDDMHKIAEDGVAAHWRYKGTERDKKFDDKIAWIKQILDWKRKSQGAVAFVETLKIDLFENEIIVFTPQGDPISLPERATPVDFAYEVHTNVGNLCSKAKVNGKLVPLDSELNSGDVVEVITQNNAKPSRAWLNFAKTNKAKSKIRASLEIETEHKPKEARLRQEKKEAEEGKVDLLECIIIKGKKAPLKIAGCCNPKLNEPIIGILTKDNKITVHKKDCTGIATLENKKEIELRWVEPEDLNIHKLRVFVTDRPGILAEILNILAKETIPVKSVNTRKRKKGITLIFKIDVKELARMREIEEMIKGVKNVSDVDSDF